ncbi:MAG TPA: NUDIX hydrolase [Chitinophagaceae bacterium]|nr:NUDIX hydrolase [Chitinophagaceae bacterium]
MKTMNWKTISSEYLFNDLWFKVRRDRCLTPGGTIVDPYYVYEFPEWVTALPVTQEGKIIMVRQYRHALGETCIEIPGGCVDESDKSFEEAIRRELLEETGYEFTSIEYLGKTSANPSTNSNLMHMFLARGGKKIAEQKLDSNEEIEIELLSVHEVKELLKENRIIQAMHVTCLKYGLEKMEEEEMDVVREDD